MQQKKILFITGFIIIFLSIGQIALINGNNSFIVNNKQIMTNKIMQVQTLKNTKTSKINQANQNRSSKKSNKMIDNSLSTNGISLNYISHPTIQISSDNDFSTFGFPGSGIVTDPYIIQGYNITQSGLNNLILIENTNAYFIIQNNLLINNYDAISLYNVKHGQILNNIINNVTTGIAISGSSSLNQIEYNTISNYTGSGVGITIAYHSNYNNITNNILLSGSQGIDLAYSKYNTIDNNQIYNDTTFGMYFTNSSSNTISNNIINYAQTGIEIYNYSNYNIVSYNTINNSISYGIQLQVYSEYNTLSYNSFSTDTYGLSITSYAHYNSIMHNTVNAINFGIELYTANYENVTYNNFSNARTNIYVYYSSNELIRSNRISGASVIGLYLQISNNSIVQNNNFINNNIGSSQAQDSGVGNKFSYNYWNDWTTPDADNNGIVDNPYLISDSAGNSDPFPSTTPRDITPPDITHPADLVVYEGTSGSTFTWIIGDKHPYLLNLSYEVTYVFTPWISYLVWITNNDFFLNATDTISVPGNLLPGNYTYTLALLDTYGNTASDSVFIRVIDINKPIITGPIDFNYNQGSTGNTITWNITEDDPHNYSIELDNNLLTSNYLPNQPITINIDGLTIGKHNYTIIARDYSGNYASDTVFVTVVDPNPPIITNKPNDETIYSGSTGNSLTWSVGDKNPWVYNVTLDNTVLVSTKPWTNGTLTVNIDGLSIGFHTLILNIYDLSGNLATSTVYITVKQNTSSSGYTNTSNNQNSQSKNSSITSASFLPFPFGFFTILGLMFVIIIRKRIYDSKFKSIK